MCVSEDMLAGGRLRFPVCNVVIYPCVKHPESHLSSGLREFL